jgi:hypothetical protein
VITVFVFGLLLWGYSVTIQLTHPRWLGGTLTHHVFLLGFRDSIVAYRRTRQTKAFLLPFQYLFRETARCLGYAKAHLDGYEGIERTAVTKIRALTYARILNHVRALSSEWKLPIIPVTGLVQHDKPQAGLDIPF